MTSYHSPLKTKEFNAYHYYGLLFILIIDIKLLDTIYLFSLHVYFKANKIKRETTRNDRTQKFRSYNKIITIKQQRKNMYLIDTYLIQHPSYIMIYYDLSSIHIDNFQPNDQDWSKDKDIIMINIIFHFYL